VNESLVKSLTGTDRVAARFLYAEAFEFLPTFKLWLAANHKPVIRGTDTAIWRRIRLVPFTVEIPEGERDPELPNRLRAELPGILAWAVQGCLLWLESGLGVPDQVRAATDAYRRESDILGAFNRRKAVPR
jgi:putative DNA primase/helicase